MERKRGSRGNMDGTECRQAKNKNPMANIIAGMIGTVQMFQNFTAIPRQSPGAWSEMSTACQQTGIAGRHGLAAILPSASQSSSH